MEWEAVAKANKIREHSHWWSLVIWAQGLVNAVRLTRKAGRTLVSLFFPLSIIIQRSIHALHTPRNRNPHSCRAQGGMALVRPLRLTF